ncbi:MAG: sugar phosphate nucleotidyltransferase [Candidatus Krumholzibacteriota bacterium]|nr:sugar phosphate nucleotidyltransferase [Candidatus Krumholzibacteriota bacterium]
MKAVIPVAGIGKRLRPHTHAVPKALISVAGRPILGHIIDHLLDMGVTELIPIIGYKGEMIREYITGEYDIKTNFVVQEEQKGIAHAVSLTRQHADNSELIIILGDTIIEADFSKIPLEGDNVLGVRKVDDPARFGIAEISDGIITRIEEKPDKPKSNLAIVGLYYFKDSAGLYRACRAIVDKDIKTKGEYQITDALALMIDEGEQFKPYRIGDWYDCGKIETLLATNRALLEKGDNKQKREGSIIIPPCWIDERCKIEKSIIGPYVSISPDCEITNSLVENSILNDGCRLQDIILADSVIGSMAEVAGSRKSVNIGNNSSLNLKK